jgi:hypothetical protein
VKPLAILLLTVALLTATAEATLAHIDTLGAPDPHWQHFPGAPTPGGPEVSTDPTGPSRAPAVPRLLEVFIYASGGLSVLLVISLLGSLWTGGARGLKRRARR